MAKIFRISLSIVVGLILIQYTIFSPNRQLGFDCPSGCTHTYGFPIEALDQNIDGGSSNFVIGNPIGFLVDITIIVVLVSIFYFGLSRFKSYFGGISLNSAFA